MRLKFATRTQVVESVVTVNSTVGRVVSTMRPEPPSFFQLTNTFGAIGVAVAVTRVPLT